MFSFHYYPNHCHISRGTSPFIRQAISRWREASKAWSTQRDAAGSPLSSPRQKSLFAGHSQRTRDRRLTPLRGANKRGRDHFRNETTGLPKSSRLSPARLVRCASMSEVSANCRGGGRDKVQPPRLIVRCSSRRNGQLLKSPRARSICPSEF